MAPRLCVVTQTTRWLSEEQQRAWRALLLGYTMLNDRLDDDLRRLFGISLAEYEVLVRLSENNGSMRMAHLADSLAHSRSRVTHTVGRMEKAGLVDRVVSCDDGRGRVAHLTDAGMDLLVKAAPHHVQGVRDYLVDLVSEDDFLTVGRVFTAVGERSAQPSPQA